MIDFIKIKLGEDKFVTIMNDKRTFNEFEILYTPL